MGYQYLGEKKVKIRKKRRCDGCGEVHTPPSVMLKRDGVYCGEMQHAYLCGPCEYFEEHSKNLDTSDPESYWSFHEYDDYKRLRQDYFNLQLNLTQ